MPSESRAEEEMQIALDELVIVHIPDLRERRSFAHNHLRIVGQFSDHPKCLPPVAVVKQVRLAGDRPHRLKFLGIPIALSFFRFEPCDPSGFEYGQRSNVFLCLPDQIRDPGMRRFVP